MGLSAWDGGGLGGGLARRNLRLGRQWGAIAVGDLGVSPLGTSTVCSDLTSDVSAGAASEDQSPGTRGVAANSDETSKWVLLEVDELTRESSSSEE